MKAMYAVRTKRRGREETWRHYAKFMNVAAVKPHVGMPIQIERSTTLYVDFVYFSPSGRLSIRMTDKWDAADCRGDDLDAWYRERGWQRMPETCT